jgi:hypothetical protein
MPEAVGPTSETVRTLVAPTSKKKHYGMELVGTFPTKEQATRAAKSLLPFRRKHSNQRNGDRLPAPKS